MPDQSLAESFARREAGAYEAAYRSFGPQMRATAMRVLHDWESASECVQDVFLYLWRRENAYSAARGSLEAFLVTCARNRALERLRQATRSRAATEKVEVRGTYVLEEDPIERERIARAVARLTEGQGAVVQLAYYRAMTLSEVAVQLDIPIGTVKARLSAALRALRRSLIPQDNHAT
ncbi:MAG: sigma-70 family RNA polymerase sigma factor [Candidatus Eremiobacteraeota bacterium]|nr:sigma-70 family RNA polymerase sigma factor [Candidatus Eremiobacteraeota bacterium]